MKTYEQYLREHTGLQFGDDDQGGYVIPTNGSKLHTSNERYQDALQPYEQDYARLISGKPSLGEGYFGSDPFTGYKTNGGVGQYDPLTIGGKQWNRAGFGFDDTMARHKDYAKIMGELGVKPEHFMDSEEYGPLVSPEVQEMLAQKFGLVGKKGEMLDSILTRMPMIAGMAISGAALGGAFPGVNAAGGEIAAGSSGILNQLGVSNPFGGATSPPSIPGTPPQSYWQMLSDAGVASDAAPAAAGTIEGSNLTANGLLNLANPQNGMAMSIPGISTPGSSGLVAGASSGGGGLFNSLRQALGLGSSVTSAAGSGSGGNSVSFLDDLFKPSNLINAAGTIGSALINSNAANKAAGIQADSAASSNALLASIYAQNRQDLEPWRTAGVNALSRLSKVTAPGSQVSEMELDPGYNFRLSEGIKALERSASAKHNLISGSSMKGIERYGQDYASGEYGNIVNRLLAQAGLGQSATNSGVQASQNYGNQASQNITGAGNARASGYVGTSNAISSGVGSFLNNYNQSNLINQLLAGRV